MEHLYSMNSSDVYVQRDQMMFFTYTKNAPRANLKKLFKRCEISSKSHQAIADFCSQYIVTPEAASLYIKHMEELKFSSELRAGERAKSKAAMRDKCFDDFEWKDLISDNSIAKLTVAQLRLYLDKFNLSKVGYKKDKVERIKAHFYLQYTRCFD